MTAGEEDGGWTSDTKEAGMQRVNLLRVPLPCEQRRKMGGGGRQRVTRG